MESETGKTNKFDTARIDAQLKKWRERLLDLTKGNPLLGINRSRVSKLLVVEPKLASLFELIVLKEEVLKMPLVRRKPKKKTDEGANSAVKEDEQPEYIVEPGDVKFDAQPKDLHRLLRRIYDNGKTTVEERGVTTLHLTFGILAWDDPVLEESSSPLLMVPCQLESHGPNAHMRLKMTDEELQVNPALELYLREKHHVILPELPEEPTEETIGLFLGQVRRAVAEQGWQVSNQCWFSTFSFESLVIYKDLSAMADIAHENPIIGAFARAGSFGEGSESLDIELDEAKTPTEVPIPILPADASQLRALTVAGSNSNLVIHGPPGTGKSQTIANLIADALGKGKKVLFVSAKMAALDVVYDRLRKLGLDRYCLEAHSTKAGKAKIIEELKRTLDLPASSQAMHFETQLSELKRVRSHLNDYVREIHRIREPLGQSIYQVIGKVGKLHAIPAIEFELPWADVLSVNREELANNVEILDGLSAQAEIFDHQSTHPWRGLTLLDNNAVKAEPLKKNIRNIVTFFEAISKNLALVEGVLIPTAQSFRLSELQKLSEVLSLIEMSDGLPDNWIELSIEQLHSLQGLFDIAHRKSEAFENLFAEYKRITSLGLKDFIQLIVPINTEFVSWSRVLKSKYWKWKTKLRRNLLPGVNVSYSALVSYRKKAIELEELERWFESQRVQLSKYVTTPLGNPKRLKQLTIQFNCALRIRQALDVGVLRCPPKETVFSEAVNRAALSLSQQIKKDDLYASINFIEINWPNGFVEKAKIDSTEINQVIERGQEILRSMHKLHEWAVLQSVVLKCRKSGLGPLLEGIESEASAKYAARIFEKRFYHQWAEAALDSTAILREFSGSIREDKIQQFRTLDIKLRNSALRSIQAKAAEPTRNVANAQPTTVQGASEIGILRRELQKRRRIKPLRKLFEEIPHVLLAIKPCMLMSPLSVSTFLKPGNISFDLVVFDEASQLPTPEGIPSILRAKQVVVAGDGNQLPPTSFFMASSIFEQDQDNLDDDFEPLESLLDDCVAVAPIFKECKIVWHYRSKDERLIKFSNHFFYNNSLITFPSSTTDDQGRGVHFVYMPEGVWDRGRSRTNRVEAKKVAQIVIDHLQTYSERSVGVVSMNASQKEAIEFALDEMIADKPELQALLDKSREEPFFIKSLENVQGDERDIIIISIGYGKTADGALSLNFGPLNREGGWRRLNVLVTRAKWQTILVTSLHSNELTAISPNNKGALMLRNFIEYAERGAQLPPEPATFTEEETNDFEEAIASALRDRGFIVDEQVGASGYRIDLAIRDPRDPNRYAMAVECDGATYHSAKSARDRDMLRQEVLRSHGWKIHRIWSPDWFRDREKALKGVIRSLDLAMHSPVSESVQAPPMPELIESIESKKREDDRRISPNVIQKIVNSSKQYSTGRPYTKFSERGGDKRILLNSSRMVELADVITQIVQVESPIHESLIIERLRDIYRVGRVGANIQRNVEDAICYAIRSIEFHLGFLYKDEGRPEGFRIPASGVVRQLSQIAPEEIENAILYLIEDQFGFAKEQLPKAILDLFGIGRLRSEATDAILLAAERFVDEGKLRLNGFTLYLA